MKFIAKIVLKFTGLQVYKYIYNTYNNSLYMVVCESTLCKKRCKPCNPVNRVIKNVINQIVKGYKFGYLNL